jgi:hypothetical protein
MSSTDTRDLGDSQKSLRSAIAGLDGPSPAASSRLSRKAARADRAAGKAEPFRHKRLLLGLGAVAVLTVVAGLLI